MYYDLKLCHEYEYIMLSDWMDNIQLFPVCMCIWKGFCTFNCQYCVHLFLIKRRIAENKKTTEII